MMVYKDKPLQDAYPDEELDNTAYSYQTLDPTGCDVTRTTVLLDKYSAGESKLVILQKRAMDSIFVNDGKHVGEDLIAVDLPISHINKRIRDKIKKLNFDNNRDDKLQPLALEYEDFVILNEYLQNHPDIQRRLRKATVKSLIQKRDDSQDFERDKTFIDNRAYSKIVDEKRSRLCIKNRDRIGHEYDLYELMRDNAAIVSNSSIQGLLSSDKESQYRKKKMEPPLGPRGLGFQRKNTFDAD